MRHRFFLTMFNDVLVCVSGLSAVALLSGFIKQVHLIRTEENQSPGRPLGW